EVVAKGKSSSWPAIIQGKLREERFTVHLASDEIDVEERFKRDKKLNHVIEVFTKRVFIYTRTRAGMQAQGIQDDNTNRLETKMSRYLTSPAIIDLRAEQLPADSHFSKGYRLAAEKNFKQAAAEFVAERKVSPDNPDVYYNLGICYRRLDDAK